MRTLKGTERKDLARESHRVMGQLNRSLGAACRVSSVIALGVERITYERTLSGVVRGLAAWAPLGNGVGVRLTIFHRGAGVEVRAYRQDRDDDEGGFVPMSIERSGILAAYGRNDTRLMHRFHGAGPAVYETVAEAIEASAGRDPEDWLSISGLTYQGVRTFVSILSRAYESRPGYFTCRER